MVELARLLQLEAGERPVHARAGAASRGTGVVANCLHPGVIRSKLARDVNPVFRGGWNLAGLFFARRNAGRRRSSIWPPRPRPARSRATTSTRSARGRWWARPRTTSSPPSSGGEARRWSGSRTRAQSSARSRRRRAAPRPTSQAIVAEDQDREEHGRADERDAGGGPQHVERVVGRVAERPAAAAAVALDGDADLREARAAGDVLELRARRRDLAAHDVDAGADAARLARRVGVGELGQKGVELGTRVGAAARGRRRTARSRRACSRCARRRRRAPRGRRARRRGSPPGSRARCARSSGPRRSR